MSAHAPSWPRRLAIGSVLVVAATVFALSFVAISEVAVAVGAVNAGMGWLVPIAIDGGIIAGCATLWAQALEGPHSFQAVRRRAAGPVSVGQRRARRRRPGRAARPRHRRGPAGDPVRSPRARRRPVPALRPHPPPRCDRWHGGYASWHTPGCGACGGPGAAARTACGSAGHRAGSPHPGRLPGRRR
ncbi:MAG: DUF2637 domain-containing protein [Micromonosporaceae bacterium]|nr:DUF2637 domain-containing protein [Micromonosporaceae bacterium]